ncbi:Inositol-1-monophosphatase [Candidatus Sumerlaea chitinivorans]|jgi:myo-inositol-1(or 4)-monophosphatase|uniref:Inositol-1-monophosphatase n=1 Tax=Sumerlaea chitinivorans TaxID=2250252 RepID=A0A2Z4Y5D9_SUMC1|nr:Inositol-1-monophosphatase [Candidatus Sumerlaea chitinivorans]
MSEITDVLIKALEAGGEVLMRHYAALDSIETKGSAKNLVTIADKQSEEAIKDVIWSHFPSHSILGEETGAQALRGSSDFRWIIDPLDGTTNYAHTMPLFAVSIGVEFKGEVVAGGVFNPYYKELFLAERGSGAALNGTPIRPSRNATLSQCLVVTGFPYDTPEVLQRCLSEIGKVLSHVHGVLRLGAAALDLCYVACGRLDVFWQRNLYPWDTAAGWLIVEEAGGKVTDFTGGQFSPFGNEVLATNGLVHEEFIQSFGNALR